MQGFRIPAPFVLGDDSTRFEYNGDGDRLSKSVNGTLTTLRWILRQAQDRLSEEQIVNITKDLLDDGTTSPLKGMGFSDLPTSAERLGLTAEYRQGASTAEIQSSLQSGKVVIVDLDAGFLDRGRVSYTFGHSIVVTHMNANAVWFHDPGLEIGGGPNRMLSSQDFRTAWDARDSRILILEK